METRFYEASHPEIYNRSEQRRIELLLTSVDRLVDNNHRKALDFGAGTGNLTGKLLQMGYKVTAVDISKEMCEILRGKYDDFAGVGSLEICNTDIEGAGFDEKEFDLITCYSVLHHLPNYVDVIRRLSFFLKKGGVM
jgi:2-polyprenyl-3-methyl-5-hydroxy-6-metoxy-1,4-benzoquinol methylase